MKNKVLLKRLLQIVLLIPAVFISYEFFIENPTKSMYNHAMRETGELGTRLIIGTLMITPLLMIFRKPGKINDILKWMSKNKRYFGVASGIYMLLHTIIYVFFINFDQIKAEFTEMSYLTGWIALFAVLPPLLTSWDSMIRKLGHDTWKRVQQLSYISAIFTLLHWVLLGDEVEVAILHFLPLLALEIYRIYMVTSEKKKVIQ